MAWPEQSIKGVLVSVEATASTSEASASFPIAKLLGLSNDGSTNILFGFDVSTALAPNAKVITLQPGEILNAEELLCGTLYYKAASGTPAFRAWGVL